MINLSTSGNAVVFTFTDSDKYLYGTGTITVPLNSLLLVTDSSNMATFKKAASNDVFVSALYSELGMTKDELISWFETNAVGSTGGGGITSGQVQTQIDQSISGKADSSWVSENYVLSSTIDAINPVSWSNDVTQSVSSASTIDDIPSAKAVFDAITTSGASYQAGRGIDITNDTISFNLPISAGTGDNSIIEGYSTSAMSYCDHAEGSRTYAKGSGYVAHAEGYKTSAMTYSSHAEGRNTKAAGEISHAEGFSTVASGKSSHAEGDCTVAYSDYSHTEGYTTSATSVSNVSGIFTYIGYQARHAEGAYTKANNCSTHAEGYFTVANNFGEHASGVYNASNSASTTWGDSGNTLFSVGNGTADNARHNAFEIRQNGDIYISKDGQDIKLQDNLGGEVSSAITSGDTNAVAGGAVYDHLNTVESVIATSLVDLDNRKLDASAYTPTDLSNYYTSAETESAITAAVSGKQDTLVAGNGISISSSDQISLGVAITGVSTTSLKLNGTHSNNNKGFCTIAGSNNEAKNTYEFVGGGQYGYSTTGSTSFGHSGNTVFSVGNGSSTSHRHSAISLRQNGDLYVVDVDNTDYANYYQKPMKRLQDYIQFKIVKLTQDAYDALVSGGTVDPNTVYYIVEQ